jgi:23S rRNA U2552 (ribose-2'-O)-methylase RlmE/FtsJ
MTEIEKDSKNMFQIYKPIVYPLTKNAKQSILDSSFDILFSNNISYPELTLGFNHFIHRAKDSTEITNKFANRKKVYLVTSPFELTIDKKEATESGIPFISIKMGLENFIKTKIDPQSPELLSRAFLKMWEMIVYFDLIPATNNFVSAHLAEGPGSFIQATILYRDLLEKEKKIKSSKTDKYFGVTLYSDNEHLLMQKEFINYYSNEKPKRLHILETISRADIKEMYGGANQNNKNLTDGDITKLHTVNLFGGAKNEKNGFAEPADLVTADGGFDWKYENLQEQEAYKLIFGEILTALKCQKNGGNFVLKIFEMYTKNTIKYVELLRGFYDEVIISKPFTSRISNSEKYIVCKGYNAKKFTASVSKKLEDILTSMNKNSQYNIIDIFSDFKLDADLLDIYKNINIQLMLEQYVGINNIVKFINLDNYNGIEYNEFLDKQIVASRFWIDTFLEPNKYNQINKIIKSYNYLKTDNFVQTQLSRTNNTKVKTPVYDKKTNELKKAFDINNFKTTSKPTPKTKTKSKSKAINKKGQTGGGENRMSGGDGMGYDSDIEEESESELTENLSDSDNTSNNSNTEYNQKLMELENSESEPEEVSPQENIINNQTGGGNKQNNHIDLNAITSDVSVSVSEYEVEEIIPQVKPAKSVKFSNSIKGKAKGKINIV